MTRWWTACEASFSSCSGGSQDTSSKAIRAHSCMPFLFGVIGFMSILALGLVPYSKLFVVLLGIDQSIIQILPNTPFFVLRVMVPLS